MLRGLHCEVTPDEAEPIHEVVRNTADGARCYLLLLGVVLGGGTRGSGLGVGLVGWMIGSVEGGKLVLDQSLKVRAEAAPPGKSAKAHSGEATGLAVQLPDWTYPVVCETATGQLKYDNFDGRWGDRKELDRFMQAYAVEKAKIESRRKGYCTTEQTLSDGSIKLVIQVNGGAA